MTNFLKYIKGKNLALLVFTTFYFFLSRFMLEIDRIFLNTPTGVYVSYTFFTLTFILIARSIKIEKQVKLFILVLGILFVILMGFAFL